MKNRPSGQSSGLGRAALQGVRVLELSRQLAGPYGALLLADLGAEVIRIELPGERKEEAPFSCFYKGDTTYFLATNRNKKSMTLDLKTKKGKEVFYDLTKESDVVFDNYRPGAVERLGIDYETLSKINPRIICCSLSGFGSTGPYRDRPAYDLIIQAMSGAMSLTGEPPPMRAGFPAADLAGGVMAAFGVTAALYAREHTGAGQKVDISLLDTQISFLAYVVADYFLTGKITGHVGVGLRAIPTFRQFRVKDGHIVITVPAGGRFWPNLCRALGREDLTTDPRFDTVSKRQENSVELSSIMEEILRTKGADEWLERFGKEDVPAGPVKTVDQALSDPQVWHRNMVVAVDHALGGEIKMAGNPVKLSQAEEIFRSPPIVGQHTDEILSEILRYGRERIDELRAEKVI